MRSSPRKPPPQPTDAGASKPRLPRLPEEHSALNITKRCNQRCVFCFEGTRASWGEPSYERVLEMLRASRDAGHDGVIFMGAEALLRPDILDVVRYGRSLGLTSVSAFTNGQALARDGFVEELAEAGLTSMQVSFHHADAETFGAAARVSPRMFERVLRGLERVAAYNRRVGADQVRKLGVSPKTVLLPQNYGRLWEIRQLLDQTLGNSFDDHMLSSVFPSASTSASEAPLEPFEGRRDELLDCLSRWDERVEVVFSMVPLCLIPGYEHLSFDPKIVAQSTRIDSNFVDKRKLAEMHQYVAYYRNNPYRWVCTDCRLLPICPCVRTSWNFDAYAPRLEQRFVPSAAASPEAILRRIFGDEPGELEEAARNVEARAQELAAVPVPEHALAVALGELSRDGLRVAELAFCPPALFSLVVEIDGVRVPVSVSLPSRRTPVTALVGYLSVAFGEGEAATPPLRRRVLDALGTLTLPPLSDWRGFPLFDEVSATTAVRVGEAFGDALWPGERSPLGAASPQLFFSTAAGVGLHLIDGAGGHVELEHQWDSPGAVHTDPRVPLFATSGGLAVHLTRLEGEPCAPSLELLAAALAVLSRRAAAGGSGVRAATLAAALLRLRSAFSCAEFVAPFEARLGARLTALEALSPLAARLSLSKDGAAVRVTLRLRPGGAGLEATPEFGGDAKTALACARTIERVLNLEERGRLQPHG
jgi:pyruvate-formate lyase-activating enzyme